MSYQEKLVGNQAIYVFALAVLLVYLVLAAQYESWIRPAAVILVVPLALLGTVIAVAVRGMDNNIYTQIGIVLIIALASKNAILIVEFARDLRLAGHGILEAAAEAAQKRFRPILMTSLAFILGVFPLVIADRGRRGEPAGLGNGRLRRHDRRDLSDDLLRPGVLRALPKPERMVERRAGDNTAASAWTVTDSVQPKVYSIFVPTVSFRFTRAFPLR